MSSFKKKKKFHLRTCGVVDIAWQKLPGMKLIYWKWLSCLENCFCSYFERTSEHHSSKVMLMLNHTRLRRAHWRSFFLLLSPGVQFSQESLDLSERGIPGNTVLRGGANQQLFCLQLWFTRYALAKCGYIPYFCYVSIDQ